MVFRHKWYIFTLDPFGPYDIVVSYAVCPSARPAIVTTLQPTIFRGSCLYLAQPLALVWAWNLVIMRFLCLFTRIQWHFEIWCHFCHTAISCTGWLWVRSVCDYLITSMTHGDGAGSWSCSLWKKGTAREDHEPLPHMVNKLATHNGDVIMGAMASTITSLAIDYSTVYSGADQRKHQSSASLAFVRGIHRSPVNSPHKGQ